MRISLFSSGRILDGQQAYEIRLVNEVVKQNEQSDAAYKRALEIAREIAQQVRVYVSPLF